LCTNNVIQSNTDKIHAWSVSS